MSTLVSIVAAGDVYHDTIFQYEVIHESAGTMIIGPFFDDHQLFYAIWSAVSVIPPFVLIVIIVPVIAWMTAESIDALLLPKLNIIRFAALGQDLGFMVAFGYQTDTTPDARSTGIREH
jgi:hypothetical protein